MREPEMGRKFENKLKFTIRDCEIRKLCEHSEQIFDTERVCLSNNYDKSNKSVD